MAGTVIALLLLVLYHQLLKRPLLALLPQAAAGRLIGTSDRFRWTPAAYQAWIVLSTVIGVTTHLIWDALVHENGSATWSPLPDSPAVTEALWWVSTLAGALAVAARGRTTRGGDRWHVRPRGGSAGLRRAVERPAGSRSRPGSSRPLSGSLSECLRGWLVGRVLVRRPGEVGQRFLRGAMYRRCDAVQ
ncbi:DUF4184 family protein [Micromonospora sp. NPDC092111]|uniref:DUF4184 family protein n=1 Tax=Micromonospora sp. NPDC092111 TaxID=3364289 RepID=UPI003818A4E6